MTAIGKTTFLGKVFNLWKDDINPVIIVPKGDFTNTGIVDHHSSLGHHDQIPGGGGVLPFPHTVAYRTGCLYGFTVEPIHQGRFAGTGRPNHGGGLSWR
jgi:hypothetical protein